MKILVLGGNGYIGSKFCSKIKSTIVDLNRFGKVHDCIVDDYRNLSREFVSSFDVIILLAAESSVSLSKLNVLKTINNNVIGFIELLEKCHSKQKIIYASSASIYGNSLGLRKETDHLDIPKGIYDMSKYDMDKYSYFYDNLDIVGLRFGTVCGFSENLRKDLIINSMLFSALDEGKIFLSGGHVKRGILFIDDLVNYIEMLIRIPPHRGRKIYNLCSYNSSVGEIARDVKNFCKEELNMDIPLIESEVSDSAYSFELNCSRIKNLLGLQDVDTSNTKLICSNIYSNLKNTKIIGSRICHTQS